MESQLRTIKQLVRDSLYAVDERAVADAIVARLSVKMTVAAAPTFRGEQRDVYQARSFRRDRDARSFRLSVSRNRSGHTV